MAIGMADDYDRYVRTVKVTVTLPEEQLAAIRALVEKGHTSSVSGFVQHAVRISLNDVAGWAAELAAALAETGGPLTDEERAWADDVLAGGGDRGAAGARTDSPNTSNPGSAA